jgi:hypothetical protein
MTETLQVDTELVQQAGARLQSIAQSIPEPPTPYRPSGGDALSAAIAAKVSEIVDPVLPQMPIVKEALARYAQNVVNAAAAYAGADQSLAAQIRARLEEFDGGANHSRGGPAGGGATPSCAPPSGPSGSAVSPVSAPAPAAQPAMGAEAVGQAMSVPMGLAQQAAQAPMQFGGMLGAVAQAAQQAAQQAMQQVAQMSPTAGEEDEKVTGEEQSDAPASEDEPQEDQATAGDESHDQVPESLTESTPEPKHNEAGPEIAL